MSTEDYFLNESVGGYIANLFIKSDIVRNNKVRLVSKMRVLEDQVFSITCATISKSIMILENPRNYYYYSGNSSSITKNHKDSSDDIIRCINYVYEGFCNRTSIKVLNEYFYKKFLPIKIDTLLGQRLHYRSSITEKFNPYIKINFWNLNNKTKIKFLLVKLMRLM